MTGNFSQQALKLLTMLLVIWMPFYHASPLPAAASDDEMVHNDNYDMIMPDDHESAASMHYQNFDEFYNAEKAANDAMDQMEMDESRLLMVQAPLPLNARGRQIRQLPEKFNVQREKRVQRSLLKGSTQPRSNVNDWEMFDYDMLLSHI